MSLNYSFSGRRVLITGGGQGIGMQIVQRFHDSGATVFTLDKNSETITQLRKHLPNVTSEVVDITDWEATTKVIESFGEIHHLVNNAAVFIPQEFMSITKEVAKLHFDVNALAGINVAQTVAKSMIASGNGGTMVNVSSVASKLTTPTQAVYSASKAAVLMLTKSMAVELGPNKIRVNVVAPGIVDAPMASAVKDVAMAINVQSFIDSRTVIKQLITTNEVADVVLFLSSSASEMITGECVCIDGGLLCT